MRQHRSISKADNPTHVEEEKSDELGIIRDGIDPIITNRSFFFQMTNQREKFTSQNYDISAD